MFIPPQTVSFNYYAFGLQSTEGDHMHPLLFVTDQFRLSKMVGEDAATCALVDLRRAGYRIIDHLPESVGEIAAAIQSNCTDVPAGIVLLGGHDVIPSQRLDCLPRRLRSTLGTITLRDRDDFIVWSDDVYGDLDGDGWPDVPVSRVPDGADRGFFLRVLAQNAREQSGRRFGLRNQFRFFADEVFGLVPGEGSMLMSLPVTTEAGPYYDARSDVMYLVLHGDHTDASRLWGEPIEMAQAMTTIDVPADAPAVVLSGCCWGAMIVDTPAAAVTQLGAGRGWRVDEALVLKFLANGTRAFVGCTGSNYSPNKPPYDYFGGALHRKFWEAHATGDSPARALLAAKRGFMSDFPHGRWSAVEQAIEYKTLREYTCVGVGW